MDLVADKCFLKGFNFLEKWLSHTFTLQTEVVPESSPVGISSGISMRQTL